MNEGGGEGKFSTIPIRLRKTRGGKAHTDKQGRNSHLIRGVEKGGAIGLLGGDRKEE